MSGLYNNSRKLVNQLSYNSSNIKDQLTTTLCIILKNYNKTQQILFLSSMITYY